VREALFEVLSARGTPMQRVLDLYSGTGALGIEAMSRGADFCDFVESDPKACEVIRQNLALTGLQERTKLWQMPVGKALARLSGPYDLVVADPPYEYDRAKKELAALVERGLLAPGGTLVVEHSQRDAWPDELAGRSQVTSRRYGDTRTTFYA
jgi:16S rRNA (guanine966-N2)-methyltransferase